MDVCNSAQDALRCELCEDLVPQMHCDLCHVDLCLHCVGKHISDVSKRHEVVPFIKRGTTLKYSFCKTHKTKLCELYCETCDVSMCIMCVLGIHKTHTCLQMSQTFNVKKEQIKKDVEELGKVIQPVYEKNVSELIIEKSNVIVHYDKLTNTANQEGEKLHREIDIIVNRRKIEITDMKTEHLRFLNKQEDELSCKLSEITQAIVDLNKLLGSNDVSLVTAYKPKSAEFRSLPSKAKITLPNISLQTINREKLNEQFGSLTTLSTTENQQFALETSQSDSLSSGYKFQFSENSPRDNSLALSPDSHETDTAVLSSPDKFLHDEPLIVTSIATGLKGLSGVVCLNDEEIWTRDMDKIMRLFNLQGEIINSIHTKSGKPSEDITLTTSGNLVYSDYEDRSVNIVRNTQIQRLVKVRGWRPRGICSTSADDLLVIMSSDDNKQTKVVRYSGSKEKQCIQFDDKGQPLFSSGSVKSICENGNLDICVADNDAGTVVVVSRTGKLHFTYSGFSSFTKECFYPVGITTDSQNRILIADYWNNRIHILDQQGEFLRYIDKCQLHLPFSLCVDTKDNLFVAENVSGKVKKIQYYI